MRKSGSQKMQSKIYISKSNRTSPDDESRVRAVLSDFDDIEVLEYRGGKSNLSKIKSCDYLIIFPNEIDQYCNPKNEGGLSKVQYDEYKAFRDANYSTYAGNTLVVTETNDYHITVKNIDDFDCAEDNDTFNYLYAFYGKQENTLRALLEDRLGYQMGESHFKQSKKSNYYHLIG